MKGEEGFLRRDLHSESPTNKAKGGIFSKGLRKNSGEHLQRPSLRKIKIPVAKFTVPDWGKKLTLGWHRFVVPARQAYIGWQTSTAPL